MTETPSAVLDRLTLVLDAFDGHARQSLAQIVRRTGLPRSSAHRMLERLVALRWLRRDGREYELGMRLVELGSLAIHQDRLHTSALPFLHELHRMTGFVVHLGVLQDGDVVYLEKVGENLGKALPTRVGGKQPAHCTAIGKVLLAHSDETPATGEELERKTRYSIASPIQLSKELQSVRDRGIAMEREEAVPRFGCIAAPIGEPGKAVAAVSICGPVDQLKFDNRLAAPLRMAALGTWRNAGGTDLRITPTLQQRRPMMASQHLPVAG
ncbi:IclR family transcriptional regulator [Gordonia neofelifaecis]|uniref:Regulatory protein, IclR n=1 Tax=Gordonia neofelifaecis NRRL B-59395 TaxID=644548 RepID=F1YPE7_9ACTN|nr:IclR family transcriptional regulator [Gordonia neofelifaecis]EGD53398.1 regulatory protein, IclR [Gordonia neofelifaecis NRRL B-59395]